MMLGANESRGLDLIYVGRVIAGMGIGCASNLTPIYISEVHCFLLFWMLVRLYMSVFADLSSCDSWPLDRAL